MNDGSTGRGPFVDWSDFWNRNRVDHEWIVNDVLARGRGHAIYATRKSGKSLLALCLMAQLAIEGTATVVYLDYEMSEDDLRERLEDMGYGPSSDLSRLHYALLPSLPPLDTQAGGRGLLGLLQSLPDPLVVVFDTTARAVEGPENAADTLRDFFRHTGTVLRKREATWLRIDHADKDADRGQRGTSAKADDVDVVWKLTTSATELVLKREASRLPWVPERVVFHRQDDPLRFSRAERDLPVGAKDVAALLDEVGVPVEDSMRTAARRLREAGYQHRNEVVFAAHRFRRETRT